MWIGRIILTAALLSIILYAGFGVTWWKSFSCDAQGYCEDALRLTLVILLHIGAIAYGIFNITKQE